MPTPLRRRIRLVRRGAWYALAGLLVLLALVLGAASQVLPLAENHPDRIAAWLSNQAGRPVAFDQVQTQWTRRGPLLRLHGLRVGEGDQAVRIGQAEVLVAMYAGLLPGRSFTELRLRGLALTLQRGDDGAWSVLGLPGQAAGADPLQSLEGLGELQVIDGRLAVVAPALGWNQQLPRIDLRLRVDGGRVRAGSRVWASDSGKPVQIAFDFNRDSGDGRAYLATGKLDFYEWTSLLQYAGVQVDAGSGRARGWAELRAHQVVELTADLDLRQLGLQGAPLTGHDTAPRVDFKQLQGLMRWRKTGAGWRFDAPRLRVGNPDDAQKLDGLVVAGGAHFALLAEQIQAAPLLAVAGLSDRLEPGLRQWLVQARPDAHLARVSVAGTRDRALRVEGRLEGIRFSAAGHSPGIDGMSGELVGDAEGFALALDRQTRLRFDWPAGFGTAHDLTLDGTLAGWREGTGWRIGTPALRVRGKDFGAHARGGLWFQGDGTRPWIDIAAEIDDAPVTAAKGFWIHHKMSKGAVDWLDSALQGGQVREGRAVISGDLDDWPFVHNNGRFEAVAKIDNGQIRFQPDWPAMDRVDAGIAFIGNGFSIAGKGQLADVQVDGFKASIADFSHSELRIEAQADADAAQLLQLLRNSPLQRQHADTFANLGAQGPARTSFRMFLPLHEHAAKGRTLGGSVALDGVRLTDKRWDLAFERVTGKVEFNEAGFSAEKLAVVHRGQPAVLSLRAGGGTRDPAQAFEAELTASLQASELLARAPEMDWLKPYVQGRSTWTLGVALPVDGKLPGQLNLRSNLIGTTLKFPAPLDKPAFLALPTTVQTAIPMGSGQIDVAFGKLLALRARGNGQQTGVHVVLGSDVVNVAPPASGLVVTGRTTALDALEWIALAKGGGSGGSLPLRHIDVLSDRLLLLGAEFPESRLQIAPAGNGLAVNLDGPALSGALKVPQSGPEPVAGKLARLHWRAARTAAEAPADAATADPFNPADVPPLALDIADLRFGDARLGSAQLRTQPLADGMRVQQLSLRSPQQQIDLQGEWTGQGAAASTQVSASIDSLDLGGLMEGLGLAGRVSGGKGTVKFDATWPGSPAAFSLATVEGNLKVEARDGQLLEVEPGAGRVLGLLSVAQLPRRMMLDFRDFFAKGFAFNRINGSVQFGKGTARSDDLVIDGPAAQINIRGTTDLRAQRFDQTIEVLPKSGNLLTVVGAVAGGPLGAAVGAAANAVLKKPLGELGAKTYRVTGPWKDPKVEVISREQSRVGAAVATDAVGAP